jgi:hypothetical protein
MQVVRKAQHVFEYADSLSEILFVVRTSLEDVSGLSK